MHGCSTRAPTLSPSPLVIITAKLGVRIHGGVNVHPGFVYGCAVHGMWGDMVAVSLYSLLLICMLCVVCAVVLSTRYPALVTCQL